MSRVRQSDLSQKHDRQYVCTYEGCTKSFNRRDYLERHAVNHLPVKPYTCHSCNRSFSRTDLYENHLLTRFHIKRANGAIIPYMPEQNQKSSKSSSRQPPTQLPSPSESPAPAYTPTVPPTTSSSNKHAHRSSHRSNSIKSIIHDITPPGSSSSSRSSSTASSSRRSSSRSTNSSNSNSSSSSQSTPASVMNISNTLAEPVASRVPPSQVFEPQLAQSSPFAPSPSLPSSQYEKNYLEQFSISKNRRGNIQPSLAHIPIQNIINNSHSPRLPLPKAGNPFMFFFAEENYNKENTLDVFQAISHYHYNNLRSYPSPPSEILQPRCYEVSDLKAHHILQYFYPYQAEFNLSTSDVASLIRTSWLNFECVNYTMHRISFIAETANPLLLAVLVYLGFYYQHPNPRKLIPLFLTLECHAHAALKACAHIGYQSKLDVILSCALLIWNNVAYLEPNCPRKSLYTPKDLLLFGDQYLSLGGCFSPPERCSFSYHNATVDSYQFTFHRPTSLDAIENQWKTWVLHESCVRLLHFINVLGIMHVDAFQNADLVPLNQLDLPMPSPDSLWVASSTEMFFHTVGPSRKIRNTSYLLVLKSMLKLPSLLDSNTMSVKLRESKDATTWTLGPFVVSCYGLAVISWGVGVGPVANFDSIHKSLNPHYSPATCPFRLPVTPNGSFVSDGMLHSRIHYAFEMLEQLGERATRKFTEADFTQYVSRQTKNTLSHLITSPESPVPWLCTVLGSIHFQLCFCSLVSENEFLDTLVNELPARLELASGRINTEPYDLIEQYLLFGDGTRAQETYKQFYHWIRDYHTENRVTLSAYYLLNLVHISSSATCGGIESRQARKLLMNALLCLWAWDYYEREQTHKDTELMEPPGYLLEYWANCEGLSTLSMQNKDLIRQSLGYLLACWEKTRKSFSAPDERYKRLKNVYFQTPKQESSPSPHLNYPPNSKKARQLQSGSGPLIQTFVLIDTAIRLDKSDPLNHTLIQLSYIVRASQN